MKTKNWLAAVAVVFLSVLAAAANANRSGAHVHSQASVATGSSATEVVPDLAARAAKFKLVRMPFHSKGLSAREIKMVDKLVEAAGLADCIYWRQSDPDGLKLYLSLAKSKSPQDLLLPPVF